MASRLKIRSDDEVVVISGKDRGKSGRVLRVDSAKQKVFVEGLNIVKRHERARPVQDAARASQIGGIVEKEGPIHVSNVMLLDSKDGKRTRVGVREGKGGKRERYSKRSGGAI